MRRLATGLVAIAAMLAAVSPSSALASTEFGDNCVANQATEFYGLFEISAPGNPLPTAAPTAGVITKWKVNLIPAPVTVPTTLKVVRVGAGTLLVVGESSGTVVSGANVFNARIPVQAGDRLGIYGPGEIGTLYCTTGGEEAQFGLFVGATPAGGSSPFETGTSNLRVPMAAILEPDADNDGYGDESQDGCPQSAAFQTPCPPVALSTSKQVRKGSVVIFVTTDTAAPVTVKGVVNLGKGKKAKLNGGTKSLTPGTLGKFTLKFSKALKAKLKELSSKKSLTLKATATGTSVSGAVTTKVVKAKLKGQG